MSKLFPNFAGRQGMRWEKKTQRERKSTEGRTGAGLQVGLDPVSRTTTKSYGNNTTTSTVGQSRVPVGIRRRTLADFRSSATYSCRGAARRRTNAASTRPPDASSECAEQAAPPAGHL